MNVKDRGGLAECHIGSQPQKVWFSILLPLKVGTGNESPPVSDQSVLIREYLIKKVQKGDSFLPCKYVSKSRVMVWEEM